MNQDNSSHRTRVLLVENHDLARNTLADMLNRCEYNVAAAANTGEAFTYLDTHGEPIDVVVTNVNLSSTSGLEFARQVQAGYPHIKIVFLVTALTGGMTIDDITAVSPYIASKAARSSLVHGIAANIACALLPGTVIPKKIFVVEPDSTVLNDMCVLMGRAGYVPLPKTLSHDQFFEDVNAAAAACLSVLPPKDGSDRFTLAQDVRMMNSRCPIILTLHGEEAFAVNGDVLGGLAPASVVMESPEATFAEKILEQLKQVVPIQ